MIEAEAVLLELYRDGPGLVGGCLARPARLALHPGQYLLASAPGLIEVTPTALFPAQVGVDTLRLAPDLPPNWLPGLPLRVRGPLGRGFHLPAAARRVALVSLDAHPLRLMPLLAPALAQGCEVVLCGENVPSGLPPQVEVLTPQAAGEAAAWADYLVLDLSPAQLGSLPRRLGWSPHQPPPLGAEALIHTPMPCGGMAECGACAVRTRHSWSLACKDGPVFPLRDLELQ